MTVPSPSDSRPLVGLTLGDPLGIGPEVIVKALADPELRSLARFVVFGMHDVMAHAADMAEISPFWWREPYDESIRVSRGVLVADFDALPIPRLEGPREATQLAGDASFQFVEEGIRHLQAGTIDALVTAPICKQAWHLARHKFRGHTDLLARRFNTRRVNMMFAAGTMRVALASDHVGLFDLRNQFTIGMVNQPIDLLDQALREWFGVPRPRIGVLALNPHAGEGGAFGDEETRIIEPAMTLARNAGLRVEGPIPADTAFTPNLLHRYDGIVAMYHDQGLIPVKMHAFHDAVNITLGLGAIRTSPDHGTAFGIAGRNQADPGSMAAAIRRAIQLANQSRKRARGATTSISKSQ